MKKNYNIKLSTDLTVDEYSKLVDSVGWKKIGDKQIEKALKNSMYVVKAIVNAKTVGMGRLIGDFACRGMITDIVINPDYQNQGIGKEIVLNIKEYIANYIDKGEKFLIELCPTVGKRNFYINCGFKYKPEITDGMYLWIEK
jgi:GNAT superfamily N-acetyltransferase